MLISRIGIVRIFMLTIVMIVTLYCYSDCQAQFSVNGDVRDSSGTAVPFVNLAVLSLPDSTFITGVTGDENGKFEFRGVNKGTYLLKASAIGFRECLPIKLNIDTSINLQTIILESSGKKLNEVTVTAIKESISFEKGMIVMSVENNPLTSGNTVWELISRLPGVFIDNQNNIILNGKSGVKVMIDGNLQRLSSQQLYSFLNSMSAETISRIEVMNQPSVKYDADGTSGMINIITKKIRIVGFSGSVSGSLSKGHSFRESIDCSLNYKGKKFTIFSNIGAADRIFYNSYIFDRTYALEGKTTYLKEKGEQINYQKLLYFKAGGDIFLTEKTTVGFFVNGGPASTPMTDIGINTVSGDNTVGYDYTPYNVYLKEDWSNPGANINLEHLFDTAGTRLTISADYSNYSGLRQADSKNSFLFQDGEEALPANNYVSTHLTDIKIFTQKADFTKNVWNEINMEAGLKSTIVNSSNNYTLEREDHLSKVLVRDDAYSNEYRYHENILAGYINFQRQFKKFSVQAGGRGEQTIVEAHNRTSGFTLTRNYLSLFPNAGADYTISEKHKMQVNFSRRINRPGYRELNPFKSYQDNYSSTIGNPYLLPQTSYVSELTHSFKNMVFNTISYNRFVNYILPYDFQNDLTKETISTLTNLKGSNYYSYNLFVQKKWFSWWNMNYSASVYYQDFRGILNSTRISRSAVAFNNNMSNDIVLPKNFRIQVNMYFAGPGVNGIQKTSSHSGIDIGIKKSLFKEKLFINLTALDLLHQNIFNMSNKFQNQDYIFISTPDSRRVWLNVQYKFGKVKVQKRSVISNEQERNRLDDKAR